MKKRGKRVGIALSSGSVRGLAHIGILKVLENEKIPIGFISATSMGAVIGAFYTSGLSINKMEEIAKTAKWKRLIDFTVPKTGFLNGKKIEKFIGSAINYRNFEDLPIPLSVVVTEINRGEKVILNRGSVAKAVRASISIPGVFSPVIVDDNILVDGGLVDPIPIDVVKEMGADIVIAVDLSLDIKQSNLFNIEQESAFINLFEKKFITSELKYLKKFIKKKGVRLPFYIWKVMDTKRIINYLITRRMPKIVEYTIKSLDILGNQLTKEKLKSPFVDVIIKPVFHGIGWAEFDKVEQCIIAGELAAREAIPKIKRLLNSKS